MVEENKDNIDEQGTLDPEPADENPDQLNETEPRSSRGKPVIVAAVLIAALLLLVGIYFYLRGKGSEPENEKAEDVVVSVKVAKAEKDSISSEVSAPGTVQAAEQSTVSSSVSAQIIQMPLLKNKVVHKGDLLAVLASKDMRAQRDEAQAALNEARLDLETLQKVTIPQTQAQTDKELSDAKANLDNTRATYDRRSELYRKGGISLKELEASQLAYTNAQNAYRLIEQNVQLNRAAVNPNAQAIAEAKIKQAQNHLNALQAQANMAEIRAPISGVVTDQFQCEGEFASSGAKLFTIADISRVIVKAQFADTVVASLETGDAVTIVPTNQPDEKMSGKVTLISRSSDPQNRTVEVWAVFGNPEGLLLTGGAVQFVVSNQTVDDAVVVPLAAVTLDASNSDSGSVMVVGEDSVAHEKKVKIGIKQDDKVQIAEGLVGGENVVVEGNYALPDGTKVEIAKDDEADHDKEKDKD
jgi:RND family efflux transporter MFP subunit